MIKNAEDCLRVYDNMVHARSPWEQHWYKLAEYIQPRKSQFYNQSSGAESYAPDSSVHARIYDTTGVHANQVLARGQVAWLTPRESTWFSYGNHDEELSQLDHVKDWYNRATQAARLALAKSNWDTEIHEAYLDRGGFGTAAIYCDYNRAKGELVFRCLPVNSYACMEGADRKVDTVGRCRKMSARQARQLFGEEALPENIRKIANDPKKSGDQSDYIQLIYPRDEAQQRGPLATNMPFAHKWIHRDTETEVSEGGFLTQPVLVTRFLRWTGVTDSDSPYGWSPAWAALPDLFQLNHLEKTLDGLAERQLNPPILWPEELDSRADLRPGGKTLVSPGQEPREWMMGGRYDVGQLRAEEKRKRVKDLFMVDLFEMFANIDQNQMTATEVNARMQEKVDQFSPTFHLVTTELLQPLIGERVFQLLLTHGHFPADIPQELQQLDENGSPNIGTPKVDFSSRMALAISAGQDHGAQRSFEAAGQLAQFRPEVWDNFNLDTHMRDSFRRNGGDPDVLVDRREMEQKRQAQAEAMAAAQMAEQGIDPAAQLAG